MKKKLLFITLFMSVLAPVVTTQTVKAEINYKDVALEGCKLVKDGVTTPEGQACLATGVAATVAGYTLYKIRKPIAKSVELIYKGTRNTVEWTYKTARDTVEWLFGTRSGTFTLGAASASTALYFAHQVTCK